MYILSGHFPINIKAWTFSIQINSGNFALNWNAIFKVSQAILYLIGNYKLLKTILQASTFASGGQAL